MLSGGKSVLTVFVNASPDLEAVQLDNWVHLGLPDETRVPSQNYYIDNLHWHSGTSTEEHTIKEKLFNEACLKFQSLSASWP